MNWDRVQRLLLALTARNDIVLAVLVMAVIFMMIIPLPTAMIDALIAMNMTFGVILLMVAVYIDSPLAFSAFPSVLLITTLFRLALSISTTRLILLQADAGEIIYAFGDFVVAGNLVVGAVIFLIITIVQFLVITKGSERVAEVSARFSLDAMPGKQMSIDGDMRAGLIDMEEARRRRALVEKESQLYGSMDGAMKFVKGDAIAGLIIIVVNILGGITIGVLQHGMSAEEALHTYSILTVGDGLVSQIPGLLIAITAGIIVTRVTTEESTNLGSDIGAQLMAQPRALLIGGFLMFLFAAVPGFPAPVFLALGLTVLSLGFVLNRLQAQPETATADALPALAPSGRPQQTKPKAPAGEEFSLTVPLMIDIDAGTEGRIDPDTLNQALIEIRQALYLDLGVPFPGIHLRFNASLDAGTYRILIQEIPMAQGRLRAGKLLCREDPEHLDILKIPYTKEDAFLPGLATTLWVEEKYHSTLAQAGIPFLEPARILTYHLSFVLKKYAAEFIGIQETRYLMEKMEAEFPELVKEVQRVLPLQKITEVLQRLVSEEISIRNLRTILEALVEWGQKEKDTVLLTEYVRGNLSRYISYKYSHGQNLLPAYLLGPDLEETIRSGIRQTSGGSYLALDPDTIRRFVDKVKTLVGDLDHAPNRPVMITSMDIRRYVRKLLENDLFGLPVLSYQELTQEITVQPLGKIDLT